MIRDFNKLTIEDFKKPLLYILDDYTRKECDLYFIEALGKIKTLRKHDAYLDINLSFDFYSGNISMKMDKAFIDLAKSADRKKEEKEE